MLRAREPAQQKTLPSTRDERARLSWFHPRSAHENTSLMRALAGPVTWPGRDKLLQRLTPVRCRANGWSSPHDAPKTALSRWPSLAVGDRADICPAHRL
jgi:hypothetical protein